MKQLFLKSIKMKELETKYNNNSTYISCLLCGKHYSNFLVEILQQSCQIETIMSPFLQIQGERHQDIKKLPQGHEVLNIQLFSDNASGIFCGRKQSNYLLKKMKNRLSTGKWWSQPPPAALPHPRTEWSVGFWPPQALVIPVNPETLVPEENIDAGQWATEWSYWPPALCLQSYQ